MRNLGNPRSFPSCYFIKYGPSSKSWWYKVFSEMMGHPEPIKNAIIKKCTKLRRINIGLESMRKMSNRTDSEIIPISIPIPILSVVLVSQRKIMIYIIKQPELGVIRLIQLCVADLLFSACMTCLYWKFLTCEHFNKGISGICCYR